MKKIIIALVLVLSLTTLTAMTVELSKELDTPKVEYTQPTNSNRANNIKPIDRNISRLD